MVANGSFSSVNVSNELHVGSGVWARTVNVMTESGYKSVDVIINDKLEELSSKIAELDAIKASVDKAMSAIEKMVAAGPAVGPAGPVGPPGPAGPQGKQGTPGLRGPATRDLASIKDVSVENLKDGDALIWSEKNKKWESKAIFE